MAQPQLLQVKLSRFDAQPWGFRLQGGTDFAQPLLVQKVNAGSLSEQAGLQPGDAVVKINDVDVFNLRHKDAQDIVVRSGNNFVITVQRGGSTWRPHVTPTGNVPQPNSPYLQTVTKTSLAHKQQDSQHIGCGYNNAARPFSNGGDGGVKSIVNKQYNTPVGIYSDESIAETLSAQAEVLAGGVLGVNFKKNEKEYQGDRSEVLKFLREEETGQSTPAFGNSHYEHDAPQQQQQQQQPQQQYNQQQQQYNQQQQQQHYHQQHHQQQQQLQQQSSTTRHVSAPVNSPKPPSTGGLPTGQNICTECERLITGVFVRIKDKNLHVECFKCATCGTSLKNQGYYNFNNKLYCDIHAKQAAINNPPSGTEGYVPVPIKPNTKLSATTISSALNSHGYGGSNSNGYSNGNSAPAPAPPESESSQELPLPPPPSPTQLLQYEEEQQQQHQQQLVSPEQHLPATQQQLQQQQHTRTHSSLSSISSGSSSSGVGGSGSGSGSGVGQSQQSYSSTLSLDRFGSPLHSRQTSASSTSLEVAVAGPPAGQGDNYTMPPSPPPPPPPQAQSQSVTNYRLQAQNENDMNTQNKSPNAYNQLLKEYSNKLQQQHHSNTQHTTTTPTSQRHNNTAKPFAGAIPPQQHLQHQQQQQPLVAALTATLANQLKFNPHQVASPQAIQATQAATVATPILTAATDSPAAAATADNMSAYVADEPSSIYGQINTNSGAIAPPPQQQQQPSAGGGDQPFEYVTLTGNVIRSVQAPGKGAGTSYKVNQGYARPFGAAAPKSPVSYPPQQQQQSPRPAPGGNINNNNPYATLPRSNVGQQVPKGATTAVKATNPHANPQTYATLPRPHPQTTDSPAQEMEKESDAITLLTESVGKIDMGDKTHAFMQEAGKIITNMLEARLANNGGQNGPLSHAGSSLSLRSNSSSNLSKSPMIVRKRLDLDDFKNLDPTQPVALQPVIAVHPQKDLATEVGVQKAQPQVPRVEQTLQMELPAQHPMGKILDLCDGGKAIDTPEPVAFRNNLRRTGATHAADRRSYIEPKQGPPVVASQNGNQSADQNGNGTQNSSPTYSVSVKALGPHSEDQKTMSEENERAVSQLLKEGKRPVCCQCNKEITSGPFITALGRIWCPDHFICVNGNCRRPLQDIGFVEEKGDLYCEYCFEKYLAPTCSKCAGKIKGDCLNAIGKHFHPECFTCGQCGKIFGNRPFFLEDGNAYCEADWNELFTTKCFACGFPVEAGDRWVEALNHNYHSQCFNCTFCKQNLEGQSFYNKGGRPFCKNHAR
ncbi:PDZ and LIM domain protein Zasp isoform X11 [Drosophila rhopaloa]|uniref:PDZ and LIM domain protein Zasp n=1 Tax=Drosophila rhopaloa TaxID=1041015 RepID=A0ABM5JGR0_DRORH|nr:PDZ and LIM domain protein Zasp isoform X11 [Drosophila rhopaloa]